MGIGKSLEAYLHGSGADVCVRVGFHDTCRLIKLYISLLPLSLLAGNTSNCSLIVLPSTVLALLLKNSKTLAPPGNRSGRIDSKIPVGTFWFDFYLANVGLGHNNSDVSGGDLHSKSTMATTASLDDDSPSVVKSKTTFSPKQVFTLRYISIQYR